MARLFVNDLMLNFKFNHSRDLLFSQTNANMMDTTAAPPSDAANIIVPGSRLYEQAKRLQVRGHARQK